MKIAFAAVFAYLVAFVVADEPLTRNAGMTSDQALAGLVTNTIDAKNNNVLVSKSNINLSKSDRAQVAKIIKEMLATHPEANQVAANLMLELLEQDGGTTRGTVARVATNPAVISHAVNIIASAARGDPATAAGHTVGLIGAAYPVAMAPPPRPVATAYIPSRTFTLSPSALGIPPRPPLRVLPPPVSNDD
ncbi:hypothetical protein F442_20907 [Phytophthora nicotianae P10297]|uniref:RxLR effector protein n=2 Tax=Phytophthora nicotianae TaxID=4792 RepID=W2PJ06_PHYN3|nr:hypothetical protein PPTG_18392 [Phytophthora nicotianae INRA-310]ETN00010.1 hypothetical protein PPTG_18392 [Phytophthora nicotianae INRA-310]ETP30034.1 hypothetical protein F442_20907 [Phytophthora nicotianae P10297]